MGAALALLPQWRSPARGTSGQQQRPGGTLAEPTREQRARADLRADHRVDLVRVEHDDVGGGSDVGVGYPRHDAVVGVHDLYFGAVTVA